MNEDLGMFLVDQITRIVPMLAFYVIGYLHGRKLIKKEGDV